MTGFERFEACFFGWAKQDVLRGDVQSIAKVLNPNGIGSDPVGVFSLGRGSLGFKNPRECSNRVEVLRCRGCRTSNLV